MEFKQKWFVPEELPSLADDEIHVWLARTDLPETTVSLLWRSLSLDERERALRYYFLRDRARFIAARGMLRTLLVSYLGWWSGNKTPSAYLLSSNRKEVEDLIRIAAILRFNYGIRGKPAVRDERSLRFNVAHSGGLVLYALTKNREVGVDIEQLRLDIPFRDIALSFFTVREAEQLLSLPSEQLPVGFFKYWTRKEAYVKAIGDGLALPLDSFDILPTPVKPDLPLVVRNARDESELLSLMDLDLEDGFAAAVAANSLDWRLRCWTW